MIAVFARPGTRGILPMSAAEFIEPGYKLNGKSQSLSREDSGESITMAA